MQLLSKIFNKVKLDTDCKFNFADNFVDIKSLIVVDLNTKNKTN